MHCISYTKNVFSITFFCIIPSLKDKCCNRIFCRCPIFLDCDKSCFGGVFTMTTTAERRFINLRKRLDQLGYRQPLGVETLPLVEKLFRYTKGDSLIT